VSRRLRTLAFALVALAALSADRLRATNSMRGDSSFLATYPKGNTLRAAGADDRLIRSIADSKR
jgi:hypothetical protein